MRASPQPPHSSDLWPEGLRPGTGGERVYLPVVRAGAVRALLPMDNPRSTRTAVRSSSAAQSRMQFLQRALLGAGLGAAVQLRLTRLGSSMISTTDDSLERMLADVAGLESASVAVHFGPPRANLKPVAKVYDDRTGRAHAVVKFGCTPLTKQLVVQEAEFLRRSGGRGSADLEIPALIHEGTWGGATFVMQSVIRFPGRHKLPSSSDRVVAEKAVVDTAPHAEGPLGESPYYADLSHRLRGLGDDPVARSVAAAGHRLLETLADEVVFTGGWHGDWAPQNVCVTASGVGAWDWERWAPDRPCGFDALHYLGQELLARDGASQSVGRRVVDQAPMLLATHQPGVRPEVLRRIAALYLVEIGHRYLTDGQRDTPSKAGRMDTWLVPALVGLDTDEHHRNELT